MASNKTTTVPSQDPAAAIASATLKIVVLGNHPDIVDKADAAAQHPVIVDRKVIWYQQIPTGLDTIFSGLPAEYSNIKAFSVSTINKVAYKIIQADPADHVQIMTAYNQAGLSQYNQ